MIFRNDWDRLSIDCDRLPIVSSSDYHMGNYSYELSHHNLLLLSIYLIICNIKMYNLSAQIEQQHKGAVT